MSSSSEEEESRSVDLQRRVWLQALFGATELRAPNPRMEKSRRLARVLLWILLLGMAAFWIGARIMGKPPGLERRAEATYLPASIALSATLFYLFPAWLRRVRPGTLDPFPNTLFFATVALGSTLLIALADARPVLAAGGSAGAYFREVGSLASSGFWRFNVWLVAIGLTADVLRHYRVFPWNTESA